MFFVHLQARSLQICNIDVFLQIPANVDDDRADDSADDDDDLLDIIQANDRRRLKLYELQNQSAAPSSGGGATKATTILPDGSEASNSSLTIEQMLGTFCLHWFLMAASLLISFLTPYFVDWPCYPKGERVTYRSHGPIIGSPPPMNTYVMPENDTYGDEYMIDSGCWNMSEDEAEWMHERENAA